MADEILRARLSALRRFSHTRFVEEISTKYCQKWILLWSLMYILFLSINWYIIGILGGRNSMPKVYELACCLSIFFFTSLLKPTLLFVFQFALEPYVNPIALHKFAQTNKNVTHFKFMRYTLVCFTVCLRALCKSYCSA